MQVFLVWFIQPSKQLVKWKYLFQGRDEGNVRIKDSWPFRDPSNNYEGSSHLNGSLHLTYPVPISFFCVTQSVEVDQFGLSMDIFKVIFFIHAKCRLYIFGRKASARTPGDPEIIWKVWENSARDHSVLMYSMKHPGSRGQCQPLSFITWLSIGVINFPLGSKKRPGTKGHSIVIKLQ